MEIATLRVDCRAKEGKVGEEGFLVSLPLPPPPLSRPTSSSCLEFNIALFYVQNICVYKENACTAGLS